MGVQAPEASARRIRQQLDLPDSAQAGLEVLAGLQPSADSLQLPDDAEAVDAMRWLDISPVDRADVLSARPSRTDDEGVWWIIERCGRQLRATMGSTGPLSDWPDLSGYGPVGRFAYVWVFVAALPAVRAYHAERGISPEVSREILRVIADQMANRRAIFGTGGLHTQNWVTHHFRGAIYALGRLHCERLVLAPGTVVDDGGPGSGDAVLGLHIPEGRLTPESVDASLSAASIFFGRHFPEESYRYAVCTSWVLDPQLVEYLGAETNIIRFQQRFTLRPAGSTDDAATVVEFLFKRPLAQLHDLPRSTTLQRAVVDHIEADRPWHFRTGWLRLPEGD
ncbi:DUF5596 domain-containing protein [Kribbella sandramycini]|uniref:DUF5596 domain-containing protein n=1 Tax=Kribbella sandramycini TaxID=60450 RepID=A0A7Y4L6I2_9ACTN|nr:acyltransferase domain-containing protein [Kribbella sandramycini]MBB6570455.1 hypothetical protein [Kribbella sandramycini]NOL45315.1 DUF5596 domain-containing protein [Kribbella sandramycini]